MIYRICTEDKNRRALQRRLDQQFEAYTVYKGRGAWRGISEASLTIEIAVLDLSLAESLGKRVLRMAEWIKKRNRQEAVLVEQVASRNTLV